MKKVSFIVRTCGRPHILRHTLQSIRRQTYQNIETVVVEDGENTAEQMIMAEFSDMNIKYCNTGVKVGRAKAGNIALSKAEGEYFIFLDDDDQVYPAHVEILMEAVNESGKKAAYSVAHEAVSIYSKKKEDYITVYKHIRYRQPFCRIFLSVNNYLPIQTVMFHRSLFEQYGGFRENLDALEDWDLWLRYVSHEDFIFVDQVTSLYRVPIKGLKRDKTLFEAYPKVSKLMGEYSCNFNFSECNEELNYILNDLKCPMWKKVLRRMKKRLYRRGTYR